TFRYIVEPFSDCGGVLPDTAVITILPYPALIAAVPNLADTVNICQGSSYEWNLLNLPNVVAGNYLPDMGSIAMPRTYSEAGLYRAIIYYDFEDENGNQQLCEETITLRLRIDPPDPLFYEIDTTICFGQTLEFAGSTFTQTGFYFADSIAMGCQVNFLLHITSATSTQVTLDTTICEGQIIQLGGNTYDQFGNYQFTAASQDGCIIQYNLNITERAAVMVELDTTLCAGETLLFAGAAFGSAGVYNVNNTIGVGCDTIYRIFLSYLPANLTGVDTAIIAGQSLAIADTVLTSSGTYTFTYPGNDGCDSLFRVNLQVTTGLRGTPLSASRYQVTNPIRSLRDFRVFDTGTGGTIGVTHLEIFTGDGRRVGTWASVSALPDERLPAGVYIYRLRPVGEDRLVVGRVVVF
ncbi:MAG: hypothetical protein WBA17_14435, partial [Saprospiraceae bacterium]